MNEKMNIRGSIHDMHRSTHLPH